MICNIFNILASVNKYDINNTYLTGNGQMNMIL